MNADPGSPGLGGTDLTTSKLAIFAAWPRAILQVAEAAYARDQGILHRDIKPSNLMMDAQGTVWVTDFGLAKAEAPMGPPRPATSWERCSTWPPSGSRTIRRVTDLYAVSATLYEMLLLRPLFRASALNRGKLIECILHHEPVLAQGP